MKLWNGFVENSNTEYLIVNATLNGNATYEYAMIATTTLLVLNSQALADSERMIPEDEYKDFHNYTINAMKYFNVISITWLNFSKQKMGDITQ